jgi:hypothetical protein
VQSDNIIIISQDAGAVAGATAAAGEEELDGASEPEDAV